MKLHSAFTASLLLAVSDPAALWAADPAPKPAAKPRLVPRPVPGLARSPVTPGSPTPVSSVSVSQQSAAVIAPSSSNDNQARILAIYRRGTFQSSSASAEQQQEKQNAPSPIAQAKPVTPLAPGQFRILTQAEAAALVAPAPPSP